MSSNNSQGPTPTLTLYEQLSSNEIRLVDVLPGSFDDTISISIRTVNLNDRPTYEALSYVWNPRDGTIDANAEPEPVTIQGYENNLLLVGPNLASALRHMRKTSTTRTMWVDAICIHQRNLAERNHQVALMGDVYSSAAEVTIWLGPSKDDSELAMDALSTGHLARGSASPAVSTFLVSLEFLIRRDWFGRVWVAQELALATTDPVVQCGYLSLHWSIFARRVHRIRARLVQLPEDDLGGEYFLPELTYDTLVRTSPLEVDGPLSTGDADVAVSSIIIITEGNGTMKKAQTETDNHVAGAVASMALRVDNLAEIRKAGRKASFFQQIQHTLYMQATDLRDRVYALLTISCETEKRLCVDYNKTVFEVSTEATAFLVKHDLCNYLCHHLWTCKRGFVFEPGASSWALDLGMLGHRQPIHGQFALSQRLVRLALEKNFLSLSLVEFSTDHKTLYTKGVSLGTTKKEKPCEDHFKTNLGVSGVFGPSSRALYPSVECIVATLFGIDVPFVLQEEILQPLTYRIVGIACFDSVHGLDQLWENDEDADADADEDEDGEDNSELPPPRISRPTKPENYVTYATV